MRAIVLLAILASASLAGCIGDEADVDGGVDENVGADEGLDVLVDSNQKWSVLYTPANQTIVFEESGSIEIMKAWDSNGCGCNRYPLRELMDADTAYHVEAILTVKHLPTVNSYPAYALLEYTAGVQMISGPDFDDGVVTNSAIVQPKGVDEVNLRVGRNGVPNEEGATATYDIRVTLTPLFDRIPEQGAAQVELAPGESLAIAPTGDAATVRIFEGDWTRVGTFDVKLSEKVFGPVKETTVVTMAPISGDARAFIIQDEEAEVPTMKHLPARRELVDLGAYAGVGLESFSHEVEQEPMQVMFRVGSGESCPVGLGCYSANEMAFALILPDGSTLTDGTSNCRVCAGGLWYAIDYGHGQLAKGTYTLTLDSPYPVVNTKVFAYVDLFEA